MQRSRIVAALLAGAVVAGGSAAIAGTPPPEGAGTAAGAPAGPAAGATEEVERRLPVWFEANRGQAAPQADFVARASGKAVALTAGGPVFTLPAAAAAESGGTVTRTMRLVLVGADRSTAQGLEPLASTSSYFLGSDPSAWRPSVPHVGRVAYRRVWPGVDLVYRGADEQLEYDFVVAPGADPSRIAVGVEGADGVSLTPEGDLVVTVGGTEVRQSKPVLYQEVGRERRPVSGSFVLTGPDRFAFSVGSYDTGLPLVIDPILSFSTSFGGQAADSVNGVGVDDAGNAYITGTTASTDLPLAAALDDAMGGTQDTFVAKLSPAGALLWSTYLGGAGNEVGNAIAVDGAGNATVVGSTTSADFPTVSPTQATKGAGTTTDAFVSRLDPTGTTLGFSTYLGGGLADIGRGVALDTANRAHVTGSTASTDFPLANAYQATKGAGSTNDAFVTAIDSSPAVTYSTYLGGAAEDFGTAIDVDPSGKSYITGETRSTNFPTVNPLKATISGACPTTNDPARICREAFVAKLDPVAASAPASLVWSTYHGGTTSTFHLEVRDVGFGIAVDAAGSAYVVGETTSDDFPVVNAVQPTRAGDNDAFVSKFTPAGDGLVYSTYLGGPSGDSLLAVDVDAGGGAHVTGSGSPAFPRVDPVGAIRSTGDAVVAQLSPSGSTLVHSTHLGGTANDFGRSIAVLASGAAVIGGSSFSTRFPSVDSLQDAPGGGNEGFIARIEPGPAAGPLVTGISPSSGPLSGGTPVVIAGTGFTGATTVRFGTVPAPSLVVESPTRMVAVSPAGSGYQRVTVTTPAGTSPANPVTEYTYGEGLWTATEPQTVRRLYPTLTLLANGKVLMAGGRASSNGPAVATAEIYDPLTNTWSGTGAMAEARFSHRATLLGDGKVLVTGGFSLLNPVFNAGGGLTNAGPVTSTAELYDPATGQWSPAGPMVRRRAIHTADRLPNGQVLLAGGRTCNLPPPAACDASFFTNSAELYDPDTKAFTSTGSLEYGRATFASVRLTDGRVLVTGGFGGLGGHSGSDGEGDPLPGGQQLNLDKTEIYDQATGVWTPSGDLTLGRARHSLLLLPDGKVIAVAGFGATTSTETWDPATGAWTVSSVIPRGRSGQCAWVLPNGDVLLHQSPGIEADLLDPETGIWRPASLTTAVHACGSGVTLPDTLVLSSNPDRFESDPAVCGSSCGKAMLAGDLPDQPWSDLYTVAPRVTGTGPRVGSAGTSVTITGSGFTGATEVRFGGVPAGSVRVDSYFQITAVAPPNAAGLSNVTVTTPGGRSNAVEFTFAKGAGYWTAASDGGVFGFGDVAFHGSLGSMRLNQPIVGIQSTPSGNGYWLVASDGGIFSYGDAGFFGSTGGITLNKPIVGMMSTPSGNGYWLIASDGGVFSYGDAGFHGSAGGAPLNQPVVGGSASSTGNGYWLVASDGGIFSYGDADFFGSTGGTTLNRPVVGMDPMPDGNGYWLVASDGGIFNYGSAPFLGSAGGVPLVRPVVGMERTPNGAGYWLVASDGGIFSYGDAVFYGSTGGKPLNQPVVGMTSRATA